MTTQTDNLLTLIPDNLDNSDKAMKPTENSLIDLPKFSTSILDNPVIKENLKQGKPTILTAKNLTSKISELSILGTLPILQAKVKKDDTYIVLLPTVYLVENSLKVCLPDLTASPTDDLKIHSLNISNIDPYAIVTDTNESIFLKVSLGIDSVAIAQSNDDILGLKDLKDLDLKESSYLFKERPQIELSLGLLELNTDYQIITLGDKESKEHQTPLMTVKHIKTGKIYENVLTNADINRNGDINNVFQIIGKQPLKPTDKKDKTPRFKYLIKWDGIDLSDLKL